MKKLSFYKREDALKAAQEFATEIDGSVNSTTVSVNTSAFDCPDGLENWSGETSAFVVIDSKNNPVAYFAFWE